MQKNLLKISSSIPLQKCCNKLAINCLQSAMPTVYLTQREYNEGQEELIQWQLMRWLLFITTSLIVEKSFALVELRWSNINSDFDPVCWWIIISVVFTALTGFSGVHCGIIWVSGKAETLTQKYMRGFRSPYEGWILNSYGISLARLRNLSYLARWNCCYLGLKILFHLWESPHNVKPILFLHFTFILVVGFTTTLRRWH